ncbi:XTP/dITP diphosphatase [soil metagenome]
MGAEPLILLATRSQDKAREIRQILAPVFKGRIVGLDEAGIPATDEEEGIEVFDTFIENAHAKAAYFLGRAGIPTLADDSGLRVDALDGAPGVRSKRYANRTDLEGRDLDDANNIRLLAELRAVPSSGRTARYLCAAVLHLPDARRYSAIGTCRGYILTQLRGTAGFGYDPLFLDADSGLSFGETDPAVKNRKSHRAAAFRALAANLPRL